MLLGVLHRGTDCTSLPLHKEGRRKKKKCFTIASLMAVIVAVAVAVAVQHE